MKIQAFRMTGTAENVSDRLHEYARKFNGATIAEFGRCVRYLALIANADSVRQLDRITTTAANDERITDAQYLTIYTEALTRAQRWQP